MKKVVNLTLVKNKKLERSNKALRSHLIKNAKAIAKDYEALSGYAIVAWDSSGNCTTAYRYKPGQVVNAFTLPLYSCEALRSRITNDKNKENII